MNRRLCNIFKTVNAMTFNKTNLESPYKVIKKFVYFSRAVQFLAIFDA